MENRFGADLQYGKIINTFQPNPTMHVPVPAPVAVPQAMKMSKVLQPNLVSSGARHENWGESVDVSVSSGAHHENWGESVSTDADGEDVKTADSSFLFTSQMKFLIGGVEGKENECL